MREETDWQEERVGELGAEDGEAKGAQAAPLLDRFSPWQWGTVALVVAEAVFALLYGGLRREGLIHSGALFVGLPAVLAILLVMAPKTKSFTGGILRGITVALLLISPLLGEGFICILIASPIFYLVGLAIGLVADSERRKRHRAARLGCLAIVLLPMCLEGVVPELTHEREQTVQVARTVTGTPNDVWAALQQPPRMDTPIPAFWRIGFPRPIAASGSGLAAGDLRTIRFSAAEGMPAGDLVMRVTQAALWRNDEPEGWLNTPYVPADKRIAEGGYAVFEAVSDRTKIDTWMRWKRAEVQFTDVGAHRTLVTWSITFDRGLDPWWYFGLWEDAAVHEAAGYLIEANATPRPAR